MKNMLINATQTEELRVAIVDSENQNLLDLIVERQSYKTKTGNIYLGTVSSVEPSLDAVFVNYGSDRHGFLPFKEIAQSYLQGDPQKKSAIKDLIREGQVVMVQVEKEERGNKGAALTTRISLAGSYVVLMPNNPKAGGISRRVEGEDRDELREILSNLPLPDEMGVIVRTAGVGKTINELQWDLNSLLKLWETINKAAAERQPPFLIHQESDIIVRTMRDYLRQDISQIIVDNAVLFQKIKEHLEQIRPDFVERLKLYQKPIPLFNAYQIEHQIESAHQREVRLTSGGAIVIDHTEALVAIDVNSARATRGSDIEDTAFKTNLEAAEKIACQLRLRDIGGLVVIDFIDMASTRHRREVENHLRNALKLDKARTQVGSISQRFGILEMSRQRLRASLGEATQVVCPRCNGWGTIRGVESLALSIIRMIEEDAVKPNTTQIQAQVPIDVATFIMNEKREAILNIEKNHNITIQILPNPDYESPRYRIRRLNRDEVYHSRHKPSYQLLEGVEEVAQTKKMSNLKMDEKPAVSTLHSQPAPLPSSGDKKASPSLIKRFLVSLFGGEESQDNKLATEGAIKVKPVLPAASVTVAKPAERSSESHGAGRRPHRAGGHKPMAKPVVKPQTPQIQTQTPVTEKEDVSQTDFKARTRRGVRGGRRRITGSSVPGVVPTPHASPAKPSIPQQARHIEEVPVPPLEHLPPFPTDLEDYYQDALRVKGVKTAAQPRPAKPETPPPVESKKLEEPPQKVEVSSVVKEEVSIKIEPAVKPVVVKAQVEKPVELNKAEAIKQDEQDN
ncbi:MAG: Rne/Rng family ribonuclease [Gammaproteobacteria bacterium]